MLSKYSKLLETDPLKTKMTTTGKITPKVTHTD